MTRWPTSPWSREAAISHLGDNDYVRLVIDAILAARDRSEQLGE
jgi:hypothetical protein